MAKKPQYVKVKKIKVKNYSDSKNKKPAKKKDNIYMA